MKKILLSVFLSLTVGVAQAALQIVNPSAIGFSGYDGEPATVTGTYNSGQWGALSASTAGTFYATYLGNESGYTNSFLSFDGGIKSLLESNTIGTTVSSQVNAGIVPFAFFDSVGSFFFNGSSQTPVVGFAILEGQKSQYGDFDYILGFNDSFSSDADYDDFVVGVKFVTSAVPEPETYAMMLIGLGMVGFTARRRKNNQV
jgi:hypothetical protein